MLLCFCWPIDVIFIFNLLVLFFIGWVYVLKLVPPPDWRTILVWAIKWFWLLSVKFRSCCCGFYVSWNYKILSFFEGRAVTYLEALFLAFEEWSFLFSDPAYERLISDDTSSCVLRYELAQLNCYSLHFGFNTWFACYTGVYDKLSSSDSEPILILVWVFVPFFFTMLLLYGRTFRLYVILESIKSW